MLTNSMLADLDSSPIATFESHLLRSSQIGSSAGDRRPNFCDSQAQRNNLVSRMADRRTLDMADHSVAISPCDAVSRRTTIADGMAAEIVQAGSGDRFESRFHAPVHLLVVYEQGARRDGDSFV